MPKDDIKMCKVTRVNRVVALPRGTTPEVNDVIAIDVQAVEGRFCIALKKPCWRAIAGLIDGADNWLEDGPHKGHKDFIPQFIEEKDVPHA